MASSILLLGADPDAARLIARTLRARGHDVTASPYAQASLSAIGDARLVVVDLVPAGAADILAQDTASPERAGRVPSGAGEVCRRIRSTPELAGLLVLAIAQSDDVDERVALLEAGADDVMAKPIDREELEARVDALLLRGEHSRQAEPEPPAELPKPDPHRVVAFFSPKGGAGTTTLAVNVAAALADGRHGSVALLDLDLQWGGVAAHLNLRPRHSVIDLARDAAALSDRTLMDTYATEHDSTVAVFAASGRPDDAETIGAAEIARLLSGLRAAYDIAVIDAGSALDERSLTILEHADKIVIPVVGEIPALRALHALLEVIGELDGVSERTVFVLNHLAPEASLKTADIESTIRHGIALHVPYHAAIYVRAANEGHPVVQSAAGSEPARHLRALAGLVMDQPVDLPAAAARRGRWGQLLRRRRAPGATAG